MPGFFISKPLNNCNLTAGNPLPVSRILQQKGTIMPATSDSNRHFLKSDVDLDNWSELEPYFKQLLTQRPDSATAMEEWLAAGDELMAAIGENGAWKYIRMTCQTDDEERSEAYTRFLREIEPKIKPLYFELQQQYLANPHHEELDHRRFEVFNRSTRNDVDLFREENIPLETEVDEKSQHYGMINGGMTVDFQGKEHTMQQMGVFAKDADQEIRREAWTLTAQRRLQEQTKLDGLFDELLQLRHQIALNAGFADFRDYSFRRKGRFDYTPDDCITFHQVIEKTVVPRVNELKRMRREVLQLDALRPWDMGVDLFIDQPLKPFGRSEELVEGVIDIFNKLHPGMGDKIDRMRSMNHLDLDSRKGKAPGGYNYPLPESGVPFIFMNAVGLHRDLTTMIHEGGHAVHAFLSRDQPLLEYRNTPSEVAELASMSMELLALPHLDRFYPDQRDRDLAIYEQFSGAIELLPWVAAVDAFQHWIYTNPQHTSEERSEQWMSLMQRFMAQEVDWSGLDDIQRTLWQRQLHIFEVPFYYIEYAISQLGALQVWRNYQHDEKKAMADYLQGLKMGYSRPIPEIYQAAGISFDFSENLIGELMTAVGDKLQDVTGRLR
jgi:oligoendopeptidase F